MQERQMEIPDDIRKMMDENPKLKKLFIEVLTDYVNLLEKRIRELQKSNRMLEKAMDELLGPNAMKWRDHPRYVQIRPIPKEAKGAENVGTKRSHHKVWPDPYPRR